MTNGHVALDSHGHSQVNWKNVNRNQKGKSTSELNSREIDLSTVRRVTGAQSLHAVILLSQVSVVEKLSQLFKEAFETSPLKCKETTTVSNMHKLSLEFMFHFEHITLCIPNAKLKRYSINNIEFCLEPT